jgi:Flp pilus assembly secretin CpaC
MAVAATPAAAQYQDPTNPEGSPMIGRFAAPVIPLGSPDPYGITPGTVAARPNTVVVQATGSSTAEGEAVSADAMEFYRATLEATTDAQLAALQKANADPSNNDSNQIKGTITHQPLIHIKARVVEVQRSDSLAVSSVLDFITANGGAAPFGDTPFSLNSLNGATRRLSGITRLPVNGLVDTTGAGAGMLINLTSANINYVASLLATELNADTITAPQVTTLNGKNVQFRAGSWVPFSLGQNLIQGETNSIQEVFYRHVGAYVSVTPQIVNWGKNHENLGRVKDSYATMEPEKTLIRVQDLIDARLTLQLLAYAPEFDLPADNPRRDEKKRAEFKNYLDQLAQSDAAKKKPAQPNEEVKKAIVDFLNGLISKGVATRTQLWQWLRGAVEPPSRPQLDATECEQCNWKPSDCTINVNLVVRISDAGTVEADTTDNDGEVVPINLSAERNVRAISNEVQLKSGHGAVIGGLITMQDVDRVRKVPFVGDLPIVGAALRSTQTERIKTETLIFIEATVLPSFDCLDQCGGPAIKSETERDFSNARTHLQGELSDGPLAYGMHRAGLQGDYLPRPTHGEEEYWQYYHQTMRHLRHHRQTSHIHDTFE